MRKLVVDLSVWIDLFHGGIIETFLSMDRDVLVSDAQLLENVEEKGLCLASFLSRFSVESYSPSEVGDAISLARMNPKLTPEDVFAFLLAKRADAILVTGDKNLKKLAEINGLQSHGTLWILDELVAAGSITKGQACESLQRIMRENARLPKDEVERRLKSWHS